MTDASDWPLRVAPVGRHDEALPRTATGRWLWHWWPAGVAMGAIFSASGTENLTTIPGGISDHAGHFVGYFVLAALVLRGFSHASWARVTPRSVTASWVLAAAYGVSDELHQRFVPGRTPAIDDWLADVAGAACALLLLAFVAVGRRLDDPTV